MRMLIMGAPGSGKGTQSEILVEMLGIPAISTGAMLRVAIADGTEIGKQAAMHINDGKLIPDEVMIKVVLERLSQKDCQNGYILDGFPRTLAQAEAMTTAGIEVDKALMIEVADETIIGRLSGRRVCPNCEASYHIIYKPSLKGDFCQACGHELIIRDDDKEETIEKRLEIYHELTAPVIEYYAKIGKLITVNGCEEVSETTKLVLKAVGITND